MIVGQIAETIFHLMIQAPNLAHLCNGTYFFIKVRYPALDTKWPPFFKMATAHASLKSYFQKNVDEVDDLCITIYVFGHEESNSAFRILISLSVIVI